jgi:hypothetical protein
MKLHTHTLPNYFTIATPDNSHYKTTTNCFDFVDRMSADLVVTLGDSWTWGQKLDSRLEEVYGNLISSKLNADWLNLAMPGANNFFIAERVEELSKLIPDLNYKKIYLICVFTETGRSFDSDHDRYIDYHSWFNQNNINNFLEFLNAECMQRIKKVVDRHNIILRTGTNFIDPVGISVDFMPWFRQLGIECDISTCVGSTGVTRLQAVEKFVQDKTTYIQWFNDLVDQSIYTDKVCSSEKLLTSHPDASGHRIWADNILKSLT